MLRRLKLDRAIRTASGRRSWQSGQLPRLREAVEALEPRRLLASVISGTSGDDSIVVTQTTVYVNGSAHAVDANSTINALGGADSVRIDSLPDALTINLGDGDNTVTYGGTDHSIDESLISATVNGGVNTDTIIFDDSNGGSSKSDRNYDFTSTTALGQTLSGIENIVLDTRHDDRPVENHNQISFSGNPTNGFGQITIDGTEEAYVDIGDPNARLDLYDLALTLNVNVPGGIGFGNGVNVYDQDTDGTQHPFSFDTVGSPASQRLSKGTFLLTMGPNIITDLYVHGSSTNDLFQVNGIAPIADVAVDGGYGNDTVQSNLADRVLDDVFKGFFEFDGGDIDGGQSGGYDVVELDDSADQVDDGDSNYTFSSDLSGRYFRKTDSSNGSTKDQITFGAGVDQIRLFADADNDTITFDAFTSFYLDGGPGNDLFIDNNIGLWGDTLIGGAGNDTLDINDRSSLSTITDYELNTDTFSINDSAVASINYDSTLEQFNLDQNDSSTTTHLNGKPADMKLDVNGYGGDDTFIVGGGDFDDGWLNGTTTLLGGDGNDSIEFDDHNDLASGATTYTFDNQTLTRIHNGQVIGGGGATPLDTTTIYGFIFAGFESQQLDSAAKVSIFAASDVINLNATPLFVDTTIIGPGSRACIVNVGNGNLDNLGGALTLSMGAGSGDTVNFNDQNATDSTVYTLGASQLTARSSTHPINFTGVDHLNLQAGTASDSIYVNAVPAGEADTVNGNAGDDYLRLGGGDVAGNLLGPVTFNGDVGNDTFQVFDSAVAADGVATNSTYTEGGITHTYETCEAFWFLGGFSLGANLDIESMLIPASITLGSADDSVQIGGGNLSNITGSVNINAGAGNNSLLLDDRQGTGHNYDVFTSQIASYKLLITTSGLSSETIQACDQNDIFTVESAVADLTIYANGGNDSITTKSGTLNLDTGSEPAGGFGDSLNINAGGTGSAVRLLGGDRIAYLYVQNGGTLQVPAGALLDVTNTYLVQAGGVIDMGGAMIVRSGSSQYDAIGASIGDGYASGSWNGTSTTAGVINSSLAHSSAIKDSVGYALAGNLLNISGSQTGSWQGQTINPGDVLVKYTYAGDANLDGRINIDDYGRIDSNVGRSGTVFGWYNGDFNFDAKINIDDYGIIDSGIGAQGSPIEQIGIDNSPASE
jgi:hypothetical protein